MSRLAVLSLTCLLWLAAGCGGADDEPPAQDDAVARAQALVDPVKEALDHPTGVVTAETAQAVLQATAADSAAGAAAALVPGGAPPAAGPQNEGSSACIAYDGTGGVIDMGCLSGGEITGMMTFSGGEVGAAVYVYYEYQNVCVASASTCLNGHGASEVTGMHGGVMTMVTAGVFDVVDDGESYHVSYGYRYVIDAETATLEYVAFVDGESYTLSASVDGDTGSFTICGSNGCFSCTYAAEGASGQCTSSDGDSFSW